MDKILRNTNIWDLHIHTPLGTPTKKNYGNASTEEFIDTIIDIYNKSNNKIGMISFTDHNKINADAYELFKIKSDIAIIPGIEVDVYLSEKDKDSKHIIFYFDEEELENIRELKTLVEDYIESNEKVIFEDFIMYLVVKRKHFAVSPHAFKQGKRGIDNDWFDEERASRGANEFTGLIFPFWEAAGKTDICKAIEFLNEQYNDEYNNQSVIAFSDSADYKKLQNYINNPHQYFRCLNSFKGLLLAGSDPDRIIYENENRPLCNPSEKIKSIRLSDDLREIKKNNVIEIEFSDRLNAIVGGRGKGKSALLDAIVYALNENEIENRTRRDFVKKFHVEITNFNDGLMPSDVKFLYFSQSYISKLFDGESQSRLESFFKKEFAHNSDVTDGTSDLHAKMEKSILCDVIEDININDEFSNFTYAHGKSTYLNVRKIREKKILLVYNQESYYDAIKNVLPEDKEIWDDQLLGELKSFSDLLVEKICIANYKRKVDFKFAALMKKKIDDVKKAKSKESERIINSKKRVEQKLRFLYNKELERIPIALSGDRSYNKDNIRRYVTEGGRVIPGASTIHFDEISRKRIFQAIDNANFSDIKLIRENYTNLKNKLGHIPALADFDKYGEMDVLRIFDNNSLGSYYKFLVKYEKEYTIRLSEDEEKAIEFISKKLASGKRIHELELLKRTLQYRHGIIGRLQKHLSEKYHCEMDEHCMENVVNMMTNEFPTSAAKKTYAQCVFLKKEQDDYGISDVYGKMLQNPEFCAILEELVDFGISRYKVNYSYQYQDTNLVLYQKYTYEDACRLLNWERNEVPLNIGGYKYDKKTKTFPIFINYDKQDNISDTTKYEDHFVAENRLIAISKSGRSMDSEDVQNFLNATERGIDVQLFVRKNKDDKISKEFYYLGRVIATGNAKQFVMPNTDKTAVEIEWELETPVREDIYQYIVNE